MLAVDRPAACLAIIDAEPDQIAMRGRVVMRRTRALLADGQGGAACRATLVSPTLHLYLSIPAQFSRSPEIG